MKSIRAILVATLLIAGVACHRSDKASRRDQQYETVPEGSASGVTATLGSAGESAAMPPLTGTNADTTTNFLLRTDTAAAGSVPVGTLAGTLPQATAAPGDAIPRAAMPPVASRQRRTTVEQPAPMMSSSPVDHGDAAPTTAPTTAPPAGAPPVAASPPTTTMPPQTDTSTTAAPPAPVPSPQTEEPPPPATETEAPPEEPPPPPPPPPGRALAT